MSLGDRLAVDFASHLYEDTLDKLVCQLTLTRMTGVVFEQRLTDSLNDLFQPLASLSAPSAGSQTYDFMLGPCNDQI